MKYSAPSSVVDVLVSAHRHQVAGALGGLAVERQLAERPDGRAVLADEQLGAHAPRSAVGRLYQARHRHGGPARVSRVYLAREVEIVVRAVNRVYEKEHGAAAHQPVLGGEVFVELVFAVLRLAAALHQLAGGVPDVALDAAAAERPDAAAVVSHQQLRARLLRRGSLRPHHRRHHQPLVSFEQIYRFVKYVLHVTARFLVDCLVRASILAQVGRECCARRARLPPDEGLTPAAPSSQPSPMKGLQGQVWMSGSAGVSPAEPRPRLTLILDFSHKGLARIGLAPLGARADSPQATLAARAP